LAIQIEGKDVSQEVEQLFNSFNNMSAQSLHIYEEQNIEQLTLERNKLEAILMSIANGVVVCDNNDNVVLVNHHAESLLET
jgi:two-component system sensor histidine kinase NblS